MPVASLGTGGGDDGCDGGSADGDGGGMCVFVVLKEL